MMRTTTGRRAAIHLSEELEAAGGVAYWSLEALEACEVGEHDDNDGGNGEKERSELVSVRLSAFLHTRRLQAELKSQASNTHSLTTYGIRLQVATRTQEKGQGDDGVSRHHDHQLRSYDEAIRTQIVMPPARSHRPSDLKRATRKAGGLIHSSCHHLASLCPALPSCPAFLNTEEMARPREAWPPQPAA